ncbi:Lrp/AsnC family transcriptional regulator [Isoptericola variabilis]|uniref:Transcriptional regulator, AsnC family n=1 Tax=Isoptericola variabilis (strain 225) TaxID=743718 RepID=F6FW79_ISOV2|nr:Lrp/AsnC family transcriptional regulator [Isoptericola variabilis]AEG45623.1 transcriptional regulator, AsnC family [Isoptericola variabilis 225]TWH25768.1 DNA-binding Lrp family transcriptional regulator [Isoptericola variabilis J7]
MDAINRKIVGHLLRDGRATYQEIGDAVGLSAPAVKRRVDLMLARGEISGFTVRVAPEELGWDIEAYVEIFCRGNISPATLQRDLAPIPEVVRVDTVTGEADAIVHVMAGSMTDIERTVEAIRTHAKVDKTRTSIVMSRVIDRPPRAGSVPGDAS